MNDYRQLFDDAIGVGEPSSVDIDGIISKQRRRMRLRNAALMTTTVAAVVAVGLGAATLPDTLAGGQPGPGRQSAGAPGSAAPVPTPSSSKEIECWRMRETDKSVLCERPTPDRSASAITYDPIIKSRMDKALKDRFAALAPTVSWDREPVPENPTFKALVFDFTDGNTNDPNSSNGTSSYGAAATTIAFGGEGSFFIAVAAWADEARFNPTGRPVGPQGRVLCLPKTDPTCTNGPNGELIQSSSQVDGESGIHHNTVGVVKADGSFVYVSSNSTTDRNTSTASKPALTVAQLTAMALDPAFSIKG